MDNTPNVLLKMFEVGIVVDESAEKMATGDFEGARDLVDKSIELVHDIVELIEEQGVSEKAMADFQDLLDVQYQLKQTAESAVICASITEDFEGEIEIICTDCKTICVHKVSPGRIGVCTNCDTVWDLGTPPLLKPSS